MDEETVEYNVIIQAVQALQNLRELQAQASSFREKVVMAANAVKEFAAQTGISAKSAASAFQILDKSISEANGELAMFGALNKQGWAEVGNAAEGGAGKAVRSIDAIRIALGALVAMLVFNVIQAFQNMVGMAISGLRELETATYNLANAEKTLSEQGIGISPEDLQNIISKLQQLDPLLSKIQATELVSSIATRVAPQVGFNKEQIQQLSEAIAVLAIRNKGLGKSFEEVEKQVTDAFLTGKVSVAINNLGVKINDQIVKDEALRLGLVKTASEFDNLTGKMEANIKAQALLSLISANAGKDLSHLPDYFKTADAAFGIFQARLQDFFTTIGVKFGPLLKQIFLELADLLTKALNYIEKNGRAMDTFVTGLVLVTKFVFNLVNAFLKLQMAIGAAGAKFLEFLSKVPGMKAVVDAVTGGTTRLDTPTSPVQQNSSEQQAQENVAKATQEAQTKIQDILKESADKKLDIERDYQRKLQDIATNYQQKLQDIARNNTQKREDALRNLNQKIEDINRDANQKIAEAQKEARQKEIDREQEFQNKLRELREKFLFDLEDALRARDARQVLRLIRQYNMDKNNLEERHKLERVQAKKDLATKLADIEYERQKKIEAAKREYAQKLEEIKIAEARELAEARLNNQRQLADARLWHQRQLQEQREYLQRKLRDLADALQAEYKLTSAAANAIVGMLSSLYGTALSGTSNLAGSALSGISTPTNPIALPGHVTYTGNPAQNNSVYGHAEGATLIATRPTKALFGEKGPERVDITPLNKPGNNVGKVFGDKSAMGMGGSVKIALELSPDLEARIIENSLDGMAVTLEKVVRSK